MRPILGAAFVAWCAASPLAAQQRAISDSDLFAFRWVASPQISPDGRQAAYLLVTVNAKHDGYETSLWLVATDGASPPRRITAGPHDGAPRWSPDGTVIAFLRPKDGHAQLYLLSLAGGEAQQLTDLTKGAGPAAWSPDGKAIAFVSSTTPEDIAKADKKDEPKSDVRVITQAEYRADDEGYLDPAEHGHIWTVSAAMPGDQPAKAHQVTSGKFDEEAPQWSRDGARGRGLESQYLDDGRQGRDRGHDGARALEPRALRRADGSAGAAHHRRPRRPRLHRHTGRAAFRADHR